MSDSTEPTPRSDSGAPVVPSVVDVAIEEAVRDGVVSDAVPEVEEASAEPATPAETSGRSRMAAPRTRPRGSNSPRRAPLIIAAIAAVVLLIVLADVAVSWGRIHPGVRIGAVEVGGMARADARSALQKAFDAGSGQPLVVTWAGKEFKVAPDALGARLDATASVDAAAAVGNGSNLFGAVSERLSAVLGGVMVEPVIRLDELAAGVALDQIDAAAAVSPVDAMVRISGTAVSVTAAKDGRALDRGRTLAAILAAFVAQTRTTAAVVATVPAAIDDAAAQRARDEAVRLIAGPVTVSFESSSVVVPRAKVAGWVVFSKETSVGAGEDPTSARATLSVSFEATRIAPVVRSLTAVRSRPARNAAFVANEGKVTIMPSAVGSGPDLVGLASDLASACLGTGKRAAVLRLTQTRPSLTTAAAKAMGITERISTYTTSYSTANPARTNNVHLLAKTFDGKLIAPGATFSFNGSAGQRTAAKGYQEAPAIVDGKLVPQLGGGVCQVGTTFFNTVFFSGLPIVERHNHSFYISHYPKGRDATVSWGGPDFKFKNDTDSWILVRTAVTASTLTIALYGTDPGYAVKYTTGPFTDVVPHKTVEVLDPTHRKGYRLVEDGGVEGCSCVVVRTVYDAGGQVVRKDTFVSHYSPKTETVRIGTKAPSVTPTGTAGP